MTTNKPPIYRHEAGFDLHAVRLATGTFILTSGFTALSGYELCLGFFSTVECKGKKVPLSAEMQSAIYRELCDMIIDDHEQLIEEIRAA